MQSVRIESRDVDHRSGDWTPPEATYLSGLTIDSSTVIKHTPRVTSTIQVNGGDDSREVDKDYLFGQES